MGSVVRKERHMFDRRWSQLGEILVNYSTRTQAGDRLLITMMEPETFPLTLAVYEHAVRAGAFPQVQFASAYLERALLMHGSDELVARVPDLERGGMEWADVSIGLRGARNPNELAGIPTERLADHKRAQGAISALRNEQTRWVLVRVPNESFAQTAGLSLGAAISTDPRPLPGRVAGADRRSRYRSHLLHGRPHLYRRRRPHQHARRRGLH